MSRSCSLRGINDLCCTQTYASAANLEISHEAAVGKIAEEIIYSTSRGLTRDEATSMIEEGFKNGYWGFPPELANETKKMIDQRLEWI